MKLLERLRPNLKRSCTVQTAPKNMGTNWMDYHSLKPYDCALYTSIRESVPIIDAALDKIVRLTGGFSVECSSKSHQAALDNFVENIRVGPCSNGLHQFINGYLDSLITHGNAVGEIVLNNKGDDIFALYNAKLSDVHIKFGDSPLEINFYSGSENLGAVPVKYPELILFTPLFPTSGEVLGSSLLKSLPFVTSILMKIFNSTSSNFERIANLRYAVTYKPGNSGLDKAYANEIAAGIATEWGDVMSATKNGVIKDFVAVGDVDIKVIGADNQMIDTEVPVRQILEQIVAKLGIPPFMLGLHWSSTERMSTQQADILTSELESYRTLLNGVILKICNMFIRMKGWGDTCNVNWDVISLQDEIESANTRLINVQAEKLEYELASIPGYNVENGKEINE